jgi:hypothetical protein
MFSTSIALGHWASKDGKSSRLCPEHFALTLKNTNTISGMPTGIDAYAGAISGVVIGVHILLRREVEGRSEAEVYSGQLRRSLDFTRVWSFPTLHGRRSRQRRRITPGRGLGVPQMRYYFPCLAPRLDRWLRRKSLRQLQSLWGAGPLLDGTPRGQTRCSSWYRAIRCGRAMFSAWNATALTRTKRCLPLVLTTGRVVAGIFTMGIICPIARGPLQFGKAAASDWSLAPVTARTATPATENVNRDVAAWLGS